MNKQLEHKLLVTVIALRIANQTKQLLLPEAITVRLSEMDFDILYIYGLQVSEKKELFVLTMQDNGRGRGVEVWNKLEITDARAEKMIDAIHYRVFQTYKQTQVVA